MPIKIRPESEYDPIEYAMGVKIEMEHTADSARLSRIVREHLEEIPDYYTRLVKMERRAKRGLAPNPSKDVISVRKDNGELVHGVLRSGSKWWFEYHCFESDESCDADLWYRSHTRVTIIGPKNFDEAFGTEAERAEAGMPLVYRIRFSDGYEKDAFEDEMMSSKNSFNRPDPPRSEKYPKGNNPPIVEEVYKTGGKWAVYEMEGPAGYRYPKRAITPKFSSQRDLRLSPEYRVWCEQNGLTHELKLIEAMRKRRQSLED